MKLALIFTQGISLQKWHNTGILDREKKIYEKHLEQKSIEEVHWFSFGSHDCKIAEELKQKGLLHQSIKVHGCPKYFDNYWGHILWSLILPINYLSIFRQCEIVKTNQMNGAWTAALCKLLSGCRFYLRTGYTYSIFIEKQKRIWIKKIFYYLVELISYKLCDIAAVSSQNDLEYVISRYNIPKERIWLLYNFIDTDYFYPNPVNEVNQSNKFIFIGRLNEQKNLFALIEAISDLELNLDIYGDGEQQEKLSELAKKLDAKVQFVGKIDNAAVPQTLRNYDYYILPSFYEGMPKTLIEAMACGILSIGTPVDGIVELIEDEKTGVLSEDTSSESIKIAIRRALNFSKNEKLKIQQNSLKIIQKNFSLYAISELESKIFSAVTK